MIQLFVDAFPEFLYAVLAGALGLLGLFVENLGAQYFTGGNMTIGIWMSVVGIVALYAGLKLAREKALPGLRAA